MNGNKLLSLSDFTLPKQAASIMPTSPGDALPVFRPAVERPGVIKWLTGPSEMIANQAPPPLEDGGGGGGSSGLDCTRLAEICRTRRPRSIFGRDKCTDCGFPESYTGGGGGGGSSGGFDCTNPCTDVVTHQSDPCPASYDCGAKPREQTGCNPPSSLGGCCIDPCTGDYYAGSAVLGCTRKLFSGCRPEDKKTPGDTTPTPLPPPPGAPDKGVDATSPEEFTTLLDLYERIFGPLATQSPTTSGGGGQAVVIPPVRGTGVSGGGPSVGLIIIIVIVAVAGYLGYRWYKSK